MLDPVNIWQSEFAGLPKTEGPEWAQNLADLLNKLTSSKLTITGIVPEITTFVFNASVFQGIAVTAVPAPPPAGATILSQAFEAAVLASTMTIPAGAAIGAPTPPTTFSAPVPAILVPSAGTAALLAALLSAVPVPDASASTVAVAFRTAFTLVTASAVGVNSVPPPGGPGPLVLPPTPLL